MTGALIALAGVASLAVWCAYRWGRTTGEARPSLPEIRRAAGDLAEFYDLAADEYERQSRRVGGTPAASYRARARTAHALVAFVDGDPEPVDHVRRQAEDLRKITRVPLDPAGR